MSIDLGEEKIIIGAIITIALVINSFIIYFTFLENNPAEIKVRNLDLSPSKADYGDSVTASVEVTNLGDVEDNYTLVLKIDNEIENWKSVSVPSGEKKTVNFEINFDFSGDYLVSIENLSENLKVIPTGGLERKENHNLPNYLSLDPWSDLITEDDIPSHLIEKNEWEWNFENGFWHIIPFDKAANRYWVDSNGNQAVGVMSFICPTESDARYMLPELENVWEEKWTNHFGTGKVFHSSFPLYGEERESFKLDQPIGEGYLINFRIQNIVVSVVVTEMSKSQAKHYASLVEERILPD
ncbi:MAG: hypothetical protein KGY45_04440 [Hadesarchaea archaeon]|nr:hypothetical protein [Hadesarchaea archaeon]